MEKAYKLEFGVEATYDIAMHIRTFWQISASKPHQESIDERVLSVLL